MTADAGSTGRTISGRTNDNRPSTAVHRALWLAASAAVIIASVCMLTITSLAMFTDLESIGGNSFTAATIIIDGSPATTAFNVPDLRPGEEATREFTVANTGTAQLRYAVTSATTEDVLAAELVFTIRQNVTSCTDADWDTTGTQIYQGLLGDSTTPGGLPIIGDAATGADPGDRVLNTASSEPLCFHVVLPGSATVQNTATTAIFNFLAEQTSNN